MKRDEFASTMMIVKEKLDYTYYDGGELERMNNKINNLQYAVSALTTILIENDLITPKEIDDLFAYSDTKIVDIYELQTSLKSQP